MTEPTDADLDELRQANGGKLNFVTFSEFRTIARAVLAKWGSQPVGAQPAPQQEAQYNHGPQAETVAEAARDVGKWLNERPNRPIDLRHVAMLCAHAQAQAAPAAVAGPRVTDAMALAFHSALSDGAIGSDEVEETKAGLRAALAAAPAQPAPQQEAQEGK